MSIETCGYLAVNSLGYGIVREFARREKITATEAARKLAQV